MIALLTLLDEEILCRAARAWEGAHDTGPPVLS